MKHPTTACAVAAVTVALATGCAGAVKNMRESAPDYAPSPGPGKAMVVFLRPSGMAFGVQSSVFEMKDKKPVLAGIVAAKKKVAYQVEPGKRLFMVVSEAGDFLSADLAAGRTYYALVTPRMGAWRARFSLRAVDKAQLATTDFASELADCRWVEVGPDSQAWASENMASIESKYSEYYPKWLEKAEGDRPRLLPEDGK